MKQVLLIIIMLLAIQFGTTSCSKDDGGGGEEESGTQLGIDETYDEVRNGVRLILSYDSTSSSFVGEIENTISSTISQVRIEVHLSNGTELGPTTPVDLTAGETQDVTLSAVGEVFETWSAHAEVG